MMAAYGRSELTSSVGIISLLILVGCRDKGELPAATTHLVAAREAVQAGDRETALAEVDASIAAEPSVWNYALRARLHAENGNDDLAAADCEAGLQLDAENEELGWIKKQLKRPVAQRFKASPPPSSK